MLVRLIEPQDDAEWLRLRMALWPQTAAEKHRQEMDAVRRNLSESPVFVVELEDGQLCGFLEASVRDYADGCETRPVGYIEGWFVDALMRGKGVGRLLVEMAEAWAILYGCQEMASDCELGNRNSLEAHLRLGYRETGRLIHFSKPLTEHMAKKPAGESRFGSRLS